MVGTLVSVRNKCIFPSFQTPRDLRLQGYLAHKKLTPPYMYQNSLSVYTVHTHPPAQSHRERHQEDVGLSRPGLSSHEERPVSLRAECSAPRCGIRSLTCIQFVPGSTLPNTEVLTSPCYGLVRSWVPPPQSPGRES